MTHQILSTVLSFFIAFSQISTAPSGAKYQEDLNETTFAVSDEVETEAVSSSEDTVNTIPANTDEVTEVASGVSGTVKWVLDSEGLLKISPVSGDSGTFESFSGEYNGAPWYSNAQNIKSVVFEGTIYGAPIMSGMFSQCRNVASIDLTNFDTSNVTDMYGMFWSCSSLVNLDVSSFDTSNVTDMGYMFSYCSKLTSLDISNFDTADVTRMGCMFQGCTGLTNLNLSNFDTSNVVDMYYMFFDCPGLTSLDLSSFNTSKVTNIVYCHPKFQLIGKLKSNFLSFRNPFCCHENSNFLSSKIQLRATENKVN